MLLYGAEENGVGNHICIAQRESDIFVSHLFRFSRTFKRDPDIDRWMRERSDESGLIARSWFEVMRNCGGNVREILHDGHPTICIGEVAFAYVNTFKAHVNIGFFRGAEIAESEGLLEGTGKFMRHVKLRPNREVNPASIKKLIETAYIDLKMRLEVE